MGKYEAAGTGLADPQTRKNIYTGIIVVAAVGLGAAITAGVLTIDDVQGFIDLVIRLVGVLGTVAALVAAALARNNVEPAEPEVNHRAGPDQILD